MNKKITSLVIAVLMMAGSTSFTAFAAMSNGTVVIGNKAFDLAYANDPVNLIEITNAIVNGGIIYVKDFNGNWINNITGGTTQANVIPAVVYKDFTNTANFGVADTDIAVGDNLIVTSVSTITSKKVDYATTKSNVGLPATVILNLSDGTTKSVAVTWTSPSYDGTKTASYTFTGSYVLPTGVAGTMPTVNVIVVVGATTEKVTDIGKIVTVSDSLFGTYEMTINSIELDSYRNQFDDTNPAEVYKVNYTYKLLAKGSEPDVGLYLYSPFESVDSTGEVGYHYIGNTNNDPEELNILGSQCTADAFVAVKNKTNSLTLFLYYNSSEGSSYVTFSIPVQ